MEKEEKILKGREKIKKEKRKRWFFSLFCTERRHTPSVRHKGGFEEGVAKLSSLLLASIGSTSAVEQKAKIRVGRQQADSA